MTTTTVTFESAADFETGTTKFWDNEVAFYNFPSATRKFQMSSVQAHSGTKSALLQLTDPTNDEDRRIHVEHNYDPTDDLELWLEASYFLPTGFVPDDWTNIHRSMTERLWVSGSLVDDFQVRTAVISSGGALKLNYVINGNVDGNSIQVRNTVVNTPIPLNQWFTVKTYVYRHLSQGVYQMWYNGALVADLHNIRTIGADPSRIQNVPRTGSSTRGWVSAGIALYTGDLPCTPKLIYVDDVTLTNGGSAPETRTLTVSVNNSSMGSVSPSVGAHTYPLNSSVTATASPNTGCKLSSWLLDGANAGSGQTCTFQMTANRALQAVFAYAVYWVNVTAGTGGTTNKTGQNTAAEGSVFTVTATANENYTFKNWILDGAASGTAATKTITGVTGTTYNLQAVFEYNPPPPETYTVTVTAGQGGSVSPSGPRTVLDGQSLAVSASPNVNYVFTRWLLNGASYSTSASITFSGTAGNAYTLLAVFTYVPPPPTTYTVNASAGTGGSITHSGTNILGAGQPFTSTATANTNYTFTRWLLNGASYSTNATVAFTGTVGSTYNMTAVFTYTPPPPPTTYTVTVSATAGGSTTPTGTRTESTPLAVSASANENYEFSNWLLNNANVGSANPYTLNGVAGNTYTLQAVFTYVPPAPTTYAVTVSAGTGGSVDPSGTSTESAPLEATATPNQDYVFDHWVLNGADVGADNPYTLEGVAGNDYTLQAIFVYVAPEPTEWTLIINSGAGGSCTPTGTQHTAAASVQVTANALGGYTFDHWVRDGEDGGDTNPISVAGAAGETHTLTAIFTPPAEPPPLPTTSLSPSTMFAHAVAAIEAATPDDVFTRAINRLENSG